MWVSKRVSFLSWCNFHLTRFHICGNTSTKESKFITFVGLFFTIYSRQKKRAVIKHAREFFLHHYNRKSVIKSHLELNFNELKLQEVIVTIFFPYFVFICNFTLRSLHLFIHSSSLVITLSACYSRLPLHLNEALVNSYVSPD